MKTKRFYYSILFLMICSIAVISCSKSNSYNSGNNNPPASDVSIKNMAFSPVSLTVSAGATVTWTNNDTTAHTVTADNGSFDSGNIAVGAKYSKVFSSAGTFSYHCTLHPEMRGTVVITSVMSGGGSGYGGSGSGGSGYGGSGY